MIEPTDVNISPTVPISRRSRGASSAAAAAGTSASVRSSAPPTCVAREAMWPRKHLASGAFFVGPEPGRSDVEVEEARVIKVEAVVVRERVETVIDAVEDETGHVGVTVIEAIGHGRQRGVTHEYRGRVFESRFLPKALLVFIVDDERADAVARSVADAARTGRESGDGIVWTTPVHAVTHNRTGQDLEEAELS
jgi:nitrogen regulatory protein P-II 1